MVASSFRSSPCRGVGPGPGPADAGVGSWPRVESGRTRRRRRGSHLGHGSRDYAERDSWSPSAAAACSTWRRPRPGARRRSASHALPGRRAHGRSRASRSSPCRRPRAVGAEVSHAAIVLHRASGRKRGIRGRGVAAASRPRRPGAHDRGAPRASRPGGVRRGRARRRDRRLARGDTSRHRALPGRPLPLLLDAVPRVVAGRGGVAGRLGRRALRAATLMGVNLARSTTCLPHRLQYPVGARTGTAHAAAWRR